MLDQLAIEKLSKQLKIDSFTIQREYLQLLFLKSFYFAKETSHVFFKGGTAIRLMMGSFRFSEDPDFTSLLKEKQLQELVENALNEISQTTTLELSFKKEKTIAGAFSGRIFQDIKSLKNPLTIRLDFSMREKPFLTDVNLIETIFPIGSYPQVSHLKAEEILAEKIRAILSRVRGRDVFDLWFLLSKQIAIDWSLANKKMVIYKKTASLKQLVERIKKIPQETIKNDLSKFLPQSHRDLVEKIKDLALEKLLH